MSLRGRQSQEIRVQGGDVLTWLGARAGVPARHVGKKKKPQAGMSHASALMLSGEGLFSSSGPLFLGFFLVYDHQAEWSFHCEYTVISPWHWAWPVGSVSSCKVMIMQRRRSEMTRDTRGGRRNVR